MRFSFLLLGIAAAALAQVKITPAQDRVRIEIAGKPYTDFIFKGGDARKPFLWPLRAASGTEVTRHFPMDTVEGEPTDHPHERGLWFAHEDVNGVDFWNNEASYKSPPPRGRIAYDQITGGKDGAFTAKLNWRDPGGTKLVEETRVTTIIVTPALRIVDLDITLTAATKVTFGDSKDGLLGIRLAPALQEDKKVKNQPEVPGPPGIISNAEGAEHEKAVWGKPSNWVDYSGEINGEKLGVAIFEHPANSRRARWHVRAYGLFAANPFGLGAFSGDKSQNGSVTLQPHETLHFRYRVIIHPGDAKTSGLAKLWTEYSK